MNTFHLSKHSIYPYDADNMRYWSKKWHISAGQLQDAILETGSLDSRELHRHLVRKGKTFSGAIYMAKLQLFHALKSFFSRFFVQQVKAIR